MNILNRHLIRAHVGPFLFALSALTGLLFLNAVAREMERLAGKGLPWDALLEFLFLSLPHTLALTLPMAVLVAVLYAFSEMAANNEVTAMRAGGISPFRILRPLLLMGALVASVMLLFNDQVLPAANHRLRNLMLDISRKSPTFILQEQVVNRVEFGTEGDVFFIRAAQIDNTTNELRDVEIMDTNSPGGSRTTRAEWGTLAYNENRTDLFLTLYDGVVLEVDRGRPGGFRQVWFDQQIVPMRGVGDEFTRQAAQERGEREMTILMLMERVWDREESRQNGIDRAAARQVANVRLALGMEVRDTANTSAWERTIQAARSPNASVGTWLARDHFVQEEVRAASSASALAASNARSIAGLQVEIHKKYALAFACIVFVLLGAPLATRFPRGGLGLVIAASSVIFAVYWVGLIGGEDLADRGIAPPWLTMWIPNLIFLAAGIALFRGMGRETATGRGGGLDEIFWQVRGWFTRKRGGAGDVIPRTGEAG
ncbi:MAG TPA: LptF/LptG family permease [Longimicrobiales bacterium]|nr:LptF/LptG family permease [Longimicrobiales bacterium]